MDLKKSHIYNLALILSRSKSTMTAADLAANLNANGFTTSYGTPYLGMRGTYTLLHSTYEVVKRLHGKAQAGIIANSFTKPNGGFAWE
jgi:virulence-associated protein VapD